MRRYWRAVAILRDDWAILDGVHNVPSRPLDLADTWLLSLWRRHSLQLHHSFISVLTYLVAAYRPIAASALASNAVTRGSSAAAFPLVARQMYHRMGTVGATAMLAGLTTLAAVLP